VFRAWLEPKHDIITNSMNPFVCLPLVNMPIRVFKTLNPGNYTCFWGCVIGLCIWYGGDCCRIFFGRALDTGEDGQGAEGQVAAMYGWSDHTLPVTGLLAGSGGPSAVVVSCSLDHTCKVSTLPAACQTHSQVATLCSLWKRIGEINEAGKFYKCLYAGGLSSGTLQLYYVHFENLLVQMSSFFQRNCLICLESRVCRFGALPLELFSGQ
jgi:hypothetical protein